MDSERVMPIPGQSGYFVSDHGNVYSSWTGSGRGARVGQTLRPLRLIVAGDGRIQVNLRRKTHRVANLVLETFVGPRPSGMQACHFPDRDTSNNALANLRWDTPTGNQRDKKVHGTTNDGERNGSARLSASDVCDIRRIAAAGTPHSALANTFGVSRSAIQQVVSRTTWKVVA